MESICHQVLILLVPADRLNVGQEIVAVIVIPLRSRCVLQVVLRDRFLSLVAAVVEDPLTLRKGVLLLICLLTTGRWKVDGAVACVEKRVACIPRVPAVDQIQSLSAVLRILVNGWLLEVSTVVLEIHQACLLRPLGVGLLCAVMSLF